ncbi:MAG: hypothetical protein A2945_03085 [Candidatus Liptonbacteria bacterium RIFCSPLOWO2_01_FULL_52_25]|uniref:DUF11 domain-containing protein n=1 Tax=Candidatus Liptonbacteria bacterium RIFCSPLOWO2_01_FULL_52_25 TaxID=1798650 RepID=A0A1G2CDY5_9BACT|nr:MAG: hypothetical protein A2945_03085 [Candidatus Liptonbacteria bacterium RIFCSPLOWO2_01_FULL_52_25]
MIKKQALLTVAHSRRYAQYSLALRSVAFGTLTIAGLIVAGFNVAHATETSGQCQLTIAKTADKTSVVPGDVVTYTIQFQNTGSANCTGGGVKVTDVLDPLLIFISSSETHASNVTAGYGSDPLYKSSTRTLSWNADVLTPGESGSVVFSAMVGQTFVCTTTVPNKAKIWADQVSSGVFSNTVNLSATGPCTPPPPPPPQTGCIEVLKETYNTLGQVKLPVAQFTFKLDNSSVIAQNDASGYAKFNTVSVGTHTVTEILPTSNWVMLNVAPQGGIVNVFAGPTCSAVVFKNQQTVDPIPPSPPPPPPTADIKANGSDGPIDISYNTSVNLTWDSTNATSCVVNPGGFTGVSGSQSSGNITAHTTFTVTCTGPGGTATDSVFIDPPQQTTITADIKANNSDGPITIQSGNSATLTWTSANATSCTVNPGGLSGTLGTQQTSNLTASQTYTITCTGSSGSASDTVIVNIQAQNIIADIKANSSDGPVTVAQNTSANLTWTSTGAASCSVIPSGFTGTSGSQPSDTIFDTETYVLICTGVSGNQAVDTVTVSANVQNTIPPTVNITSNPSVLNQGQSSSLNWNSQNATTCYASGNWYGNKALSGGETVTPPYTSTYTITCTNNIGQQATAQTSIIVNTFNNNQQPTLTLTATPTSITQGQNSVLSWYSNNANSCSASVGWFGSKNVTGSETVSPLTTTTYTITCINNYGVAQASQVVGVISTPFVTGNNPSITKTVRNVTLNQTIFSNGVQGQGPDILEFEIRVRNTDANTANLTVRDILPQQLFYVTGSTTSNGTTAVDGIVGAGLTLPSVAPNEERVIRFRAVIFSGIAQGTVITNQATVVTQTGSTQNGFATVTVSNRGQVLGITDIPTGPEDVLPIVLVLGLVGSIFSHVIIFKKGWNPMPRLAMVGGGVTSLLRNEPAGKRATRELECELALIRAQETKNDTGGYET